MASYKLMFSKRLDAVWGKMKIFDMKTGKQVFMCNARSGQAYCQVQFWNRGASPIPPTSEVESSMWVNLTHYCPGDTSAMGRIYYHVEPDPIVCRFNKSLIRQEIGIHSDENHEYKPGSAGCIVMLPDDFKRWHKKVQELLAKVPGEVGWPLDVIYY